MDIEVSVDIDQAVRSLKRVGERNIPLAVAQGLTATAKHLKNVQTRVIPKYIDRPAKFTQRAFAIRMARAVDFRRGEIFSRVFAKRIQEDYLRYAVYGGSRRARSRAIVVPGPDARLNKFGNFPRGYIKRELAKPESFSGNIGGVSGIWKRTKRGRNKLIAIYTPTADYEKRYPFYEISARVVPRELRKQLNRGIKRAARK